MSFERVYELFRAARELASSVERDRYLAAHAEDLETRHAVEDLLRHHDEASASAPEEVVSPLREALEATMNGAPEGAPDRIGAFRIEGLLGRGGMATVYRAVQERPARDVALKVLHGGLGEGGAVERFRREAQVLAQLDHEGIATVFEVGEASTPGGPVAYIAMQLVDGHHLNDARTPLDQKQIVDLVLQVLDAVSHAHQHGVVHRDLKPSNVLVDERGRCKLLDFGIARILGDDSHQTKTGDVLGTLRYMSPEQAAGDGRLVDTRSDVHAVGLMAYELLAGRHPWGDVDEGPAALIQAALSSTPQALRSVNPDVPADLATIVHKAIMPEPDRRYAGAAAFADDLRRFMEGRPVEARDPTLRYHVSKFVGRNRTLVAVACIGLLTLVVALVLALSALQTAEKERARANQHAADVEAGAARLRLQAAHLALTEHRLVGAMEHLEAVPPERRGWVWGYLRAQCDMSVSATSRLPGKNAVRLAGTGLLEPAHTRNDVFSMNGFQVIFGEAPDERAYMPPTRAWWPVPWMEGADVRLIFERVQLRSSAEEEETVLGSLRASTLGFDLAGRRVLVGTHDRRVVAWDPVGRNQRDLGIEAAGAVTALACDQATDRLAVASARGVVQLFRITSGELLETLHAGDRAPQRMVFTHGGRYLVALDRGELVVLAPGAAERMGRLALPDQGRRAFVYGVAVSPQSDQVAAATWSGTAEIFDLTRMRHLASHAVSRKHVAAVRFLGAGAQLLAFGSGRLVRMDALDGDVNAEVRGGGAGEDLALSQSAGVAAVLHLRPRTCRAHVMHLADGRGEVVELARASHEVGRAPQLSRWTTLDFDRGGQRLLRRAIGGWAMNRWPTGELLAAGETREDLGAIVRIRFLGEDGFVAGTDRGFVTVRELPGGRERYRLAGHDGAVWALATHPQEPLLASGGRTGRSESGRWPLANR